jgi:hypothetical protein
VSAFVLEGVSIIECCSLSLYTSLCTVKNMFPLPRLFATDADAIFRMGGAAVLMTNKPSLRSRCKYELAAASRVHTGANDASYNCMSWGPDGCEWLLACVSTLRNHHIALMHRLASATTILKPPAAAAASFVRACACVCAFRTQPV